MLVYFKNKDQNFPKVNVEPKETMEELVNKFQELGSVEKVRLTMIRYSCNCGNDLTDALLEGISKEISILVDSDNSSQISGFTVYSIYEELDSKSIRESVLDDV